VARESLGCYKSQFRPGQPVDPAAQGPEWRIVLQPVDAR